MKITCEKFIRHHKENPEVYKLFAEFTYEAIRAGRTYFGADFIINRLRWFTMIESKGEPYKINSNYEPFYTRLFEFRNSKYKGFFRKKKSEADKLRYNRITKEVWYQKEVLNAVKND